MVLVGQGPFIIDEGQEAVFNHGSDVVINAYEERDQR